MSSRNDRKKRESMARVRCLRAMREVPGSEATVRTYYEQCRTNALTAVSQGNQTAHAYWTGRADGLEDLQQRMFASLAITGDNETEVVTNTDG